MKHTGNIRFSERQRFWKFKLKAIYSELSLSTITGESYLKVPHYVFNVIIEENFIKTLGTDWKRQRKSFTSLFKHENIIKNQNRTEVKILY